MRRMLGLGCALAVMAGWGCGDDDGPASDGGGVADGGGVTDGGGGTDGGAPADAASVDAGSLDGGGGADAGAGCGNRVIDPGEECDDGNTAAGDGCDGSCLREPSASCGDGVVDYAMGEECDDMNSADGDGCDSACRREVGSSCGDGTLDIADGEQCDDGNTTAGDGCSPTCQFEPVGAFCGDGTMDVGEVCDDGNTAAGDMCNPTCNFRNQTTLFVGMPGVAGSLDGTGMAASIGGYGVLAADDTYLWFADGANRKVRRIEVATRNVVTVAGNGVAAVVDHATGSMASFNGVESITTDGTTVWVTDTRRIRAIEAAAPHGVTTIAGSNATGCADGTGAAARFSDARGATYYGGYVWVVDANCATVRRVDPTSGEVMTVAGSPGMTGTADGVGSAARFISPRYIASDNSGMLYIADTNGATIRAYNTVTGAVTTFAGTGTAGYADGVGTAVQIHRPRGMTSDGTSIYFVEFNMHTVRQGVLGTGEVSTMLGMMGTTGYTEGFGTATRFDQPFGITFHYPSGSLFVVDSGNQVIRRVR